MRRPRTSAIAAVCARKGYVSKAQMDQQRAARDAAEAALRRRPGPSLAQVGAAAGLHGGARAFAGIITRRFVHVGEAVQAGPPSPQPLIALQSLDDLRVNVQVPQSAVDAIRRFHAADVLPGGRACRRVPAAMSRCFPYADRATHTFNVRLQLAAGDRRPVSGHDGEGGLRHRRGEAPAGAGIGAGRSAAKWSASMWSTATDVALRQVRLGDRDGDQVEVLAGLDDGERVASDPQAASGAGCAAQRAAGRVRHE